MKNNEYESKACIKIGYTYPSSWKAVKITLAKPTNLREFLVVLWGTDVFIHEVPIIKLEILIFILICVFK